MKLVDEKWKKAVNVIRPMDAIFSTNCSSILILWNEIFALLYHWLNCTPYRKSVCADTF